MTTYIPAYKQAPNSSCSAQLSSAPPPGSIMAYFGGGNNSGSGDPDGWVIADGTPRSNASDKRYDYIANVLLIGTISGSTYTPPDLRGAFLRGAKRQASSSYGSYAQDVKTSQNHATEKHNHGISDPGHNHGTKTNVFGANGSGYTVLTTETRPIGSYSHLVEIYSSATGITINDTSTNVHDNETRPYNFGVNWIIKL